MEELTAAEAIIKPKLLIRGFSQDVLTNNRGLIGATIEDTLQYANHVTKEKDKEIEDLEKYKVFTKSLLDEAKKRSDKDKEIGLPNWIIQHIAKLLNK
jgi:hypothetical protein